MKKFILLLGIFLITSKINTVWAQELEWDFPIKPGSEKWKSFKTSKEKVNVCEIPIEVLKKLKTSELLKICLKHPLLLDYTAANSPYEGIKTITQIFNGFHEFINRKDAPEILKNFI